jgi:hypothetical protein
VAVSNDSLRDLLRKKLDEASEAAVKGDAPQATIDELERLARLIEIRERTTPAPPSPRWRVAAVVAATVLLVSLLLFFRVSETEVELDVTVSEVGFVLSRPQAVTDITNMKSVRVSGSRNLELPEPARSELSKTGGSDPGPYVQVATSTRTDRVGTVTMAPLALPAGAEITVYSTTSPRNRRIELEDASAPVRITVHGPVRLDLATEARDVDFTTPKSIVLDTDENGAVIEWVAAEDSSSAIAPQIEVERLTLSQVDRFQTSSGTTTETISTVLSGTMYLESLNGAPYKLRSRELVQFADIRGVIRTLTIKDDQVTVNFRGRTRGIKSGWGNSPSDLMPSYLAWLQAQHGLSLLWATTIYVFGIVATMLRWWRVQL